MESCRTDRYRSKFRTELASCSRLQGILTSTAHSSSVPIDLSTAKVLIPHPLHTRPALSRTSHSDWRDQSAGTLEIRLDQTPVHHCCSAENKPLSTSGQLPAPYRTTTVSSVPILRRRRRDGAACSTLLSVTHAGTLIHQLHQLN